MSCSKMLSVTGHRGFVLPACFFAKIESIFRRGCVLPVYLLRRFSVLAIVGFAVREFMILFKMVCRRVPVTFKIFFHDILHGAV